MNITIIIVPEYNNNSVEDILMLFKIYHSQQLLSQEII